MSEVSATSALSGKSDAEIEELLDRMLTRLALCHDSGLENLLSKLLPLCISCLTSQSSDVRNKIMEILSHVNKRVKHDLEIGLPLSNLWKLYMEANATPIVRNFCIVYIEMALERVTKEEKKNFGPVLVANITNLPSQHHDIILRMAVRVIGECHSDQITDEAATKYKASRDSHNNKIFLEFCLHLLLYQPPSQGGGCPSALSIAQSDRVTGKKPLKSDALLTRKLGVLNVVGAMEFLPELVYPLFIAASVDCHELVAKRAEDLLKKKASGVNLDDTTLINGLFLLCNGTSVTEQIPQEYRVSPGNPALKVRLMSVFCRSITAANSFPSTLQCIFGCIYGNATTLRLKQQGMEFTVWVFKHARMDQLKIMGPVILNGILKSLDDHSAAGPGATGREIKAFAYQAIGLLAQRMPQLFNNQIDMAVRLFKDLETEAEFFHLTIQEATNAVAVAYRDASTTILNDLESLLLKSCQVEKSEVRFCAVRWATSLFDLDHCPSRFICMIGAADSKLDIREMSLEGLFPGKDQRITTSENLNLNYPKVGNMLDYIFQQQPAFQDSMEMNGRKLFFPSGMYVAMIEFLLRCLEAEMGQNNLPERASCLLWVDRMLMLLEHAMAYEGSVELHAKASKALITVGSHFPEIVAHQYSNKVSWLKQFLNHVDLDTRESITRLLGIASLVLPISALSDLIYELVSSIDGSLNLRFEKLHGVLCALGYIASNCLSRKPTISESLFQNILKCLIDVVKLENATLASVAMQALGHIGLSATLPLLLYESDSVSIWKVLHEKLKKLISGDDNKAIQKIVIALGHMSVNESSFANLNDALDLIFGLSRSKVEDVLFAAGEALSFMWGGVPVTADIILKTNYTSLSLRSSFLMGNVFPLLSKYKTQSDPNGNGHANARDAIHRKLFDVLLYSNRKEERCAGTVWLLSLTMYCGRHPGIQQLLPDIQEAFSHLLGDQNELTQELASQGLSIVYELGDDSMKKNLVNALVGTLTGSGKRKRVVKLVEDTELFQDNTIGESPSGGKLTTYKELCDLANEMGQPDLIYKLMDLANYHASLNSKRGAAYGFSKIAKQAGDALQPHLSLLIPRLVRYQYYPDKNVQDAMAHIWKALVTDSKKTIDEHLDLIIDDLLKQCSSRLWHSREASCLALADIIQGRKFGQVSIYLKKIWIAAFRAMDDIKETVRKSGDRLCRAVTSLTSRICDVSLTDLSDAKQAMDIVLPLFLTDGILSKVDSVRTTSIGMITKLAKGAGSAIGPHLADVVCCMLESLSSLEDQGLNYVELHAANVGIQADKLESLRISIAKGSPMWGTLDICVEFVNAESLELLVPRLSQLVRSGVGLNTRVGVASFISMLVQNVGTDIKPFTNTLLKLLIPATKEEKSAATKRAFANACAIVLNHASVSQAQKLIEDTTALHSGDKNDQISCAILLRSYSSIAMDVLSRYHAVIVPVMFVSRFENDKNISSLYEELWEESMSSERVTLKLFLGEIVTLINGEIMSSSWEQKKTAAQAIMKLSEVLGESLSPYHHIILTSLMKEVPGRFWEGKDALLYALSSVCKSCREGILTNGTVTPDAILELITSSFTKKVKKYRESAFFCLDEVVKAFKIPNFFNIVFPLMLEMCNSVADAVSGRDAKSEPDEKEEFSAQDKIVNCITSCINVAHVTDILEQHKNLLRVYMISLSSRFSWTVKMSVFSSLKELCSRLQYAANNPLETGLHEAITCFVHELFNLLSPRVIECIGTIKIAQLHIVASECLLDVSNLYEAISPLHYSEIGFKAELFHQFEIEKNELARSLMKKCIGVYERLEKKGSRD